MATRSLQNGRNVIFCMAIFVVVAMNLIGNSCASRLRYGAIRSDGRRPCSPKHPENCLGKPANRYSRGCNKGGEHCRGSNGKDEAIIAVGRRGKHPIPSPSLVHEHHHHRHHHRHHHDHDGETKHHAYDSKVFNPSLIPNKGAKPAVINY